MRLIRYRKPSLSTLLGVTAAKRSIKRSLGASQVQGFIEPSRLTRPSAGSSVFAAGVRRGT